jgi:predicted enzyme related to lactoylglutathione lyase
MVTSGVAVMDLLVNIDVPDRARGIAFYTRGLGLQTGRSLGPDVVELLGGPVPIYLLVAAEGSRPVRFGTDVRTYRRHWSPVHLDFVVPDVDAAVERAVEAGAVVERPATTEVWGGIAGLADPFGNGFCLLQFLNRGYDEIATA